MVRARDGQGQGLPSENFCRGVAGTAATSWSIVQESHAETAETVDPRSSCTHHKSAPSHSALWLPGLPSGCITSISASASSHPCLHASRALAENHMTRAAAIEGSNKVWSQRGAKPAQVCEESYKPGLCQAETAKGPATGHGTEALLAEATSLTSQTHEFRYRVYTQHCSLQRRFHFYSSLTLSVAAWKSPFKLLQGWHANLHQIIIQASCTSFSGGEGASVSSFRTLTLAVSFPDHQNGQSQESSQPRPL